jgi:hypothetical protein
MMNHHARSIQIGWSAPSQEQTMSDSRTAQEASSLFVEVARRSSPVTGIFDTHFDRNSEQLDSCTPATGLTTKSRVAKNTVAIIISAHCLSSQLFDKGGLEKFPGKKTFLKNSARRNFSAKQSSIKE